MIYGTEKDMEEKPKRARKPKVKSNALPVEQINELMFIHNKNDPQTGVQAVSGIDEKGKVQTVPADERNENSFLKFEKNSSILENFIKNFWSQLKEPTHFRLIRMTIHDYKQNKQAIKELSQGKETDTVKEFLKRYEIRPRENREQSKNEKEKETMAKSKPHRKSTATGTNTADAGAAGSTLPLQRKHGELGGTGKDRCLESLTRTAGTVGFHAERIQDKQAGSAHPDPDKC